MGYYLRVLSTSADCVSLSALQSTIAKNKLRATLSTDAGSDDWTQLILRHADGKEIASIERNLVEAGSLGAEELAEFADEVAECKPANAARWLLDYFSRVRCIYAFQVLSGTDHKNGWEILDAVKNRIWTSAPSILQADNEGFSNEDGYHILWQFSDSVEGEWWMAVFQEGQWNRFQMDLGNQKQRESFFQGQIPDGAKFS
ncbi:MAG TPA: hypothetical protein VFH15_07950 [Pyrinomonadaceae bacterium]|nr:hypothetical protein [Pyrinomonadaceae bacterium]